MTKDVFLECSLAVKKIYEYSLTHEYQKKQQDIVEEEKEARRVGQRKEQKKKRKMTVDPEEETKIRNRIRRNKPKPFLFSSYFSLIFIFNNVFYFMYVLCMNFVMHYT